MTPVNLVITDWLLIKLAVLVQNVNSVCSQNYTDTETIKAQTFLLHISPLI